MHKQILTSQQSELIDLLRMFSKEYYLVGGTAIALYLGHRRSIDFDLFSYKNIKRKGIRNIIEKFNFPIQQVLYEDSEQLHLIINDVKLTFFHFPYEILPKRYFKNFIKIPELIDLAAMKVFSLGRRGKWKD